MKKTLLFIFIVLGALFLNTSCRKKYSVPEVTYIDRVLVKAYERTLNGAKVVEYVGAEETLEDWTTLFSIRQYNDKISPEDLISAMVLQIEQLGPSHGVIESKVLSVYSLEEKQVFILEFTLENKEFLEYNLFRYIPDASGSLLSYHLAKRIVKEPGKEAGGFTEVWAEENLQTRKKDIQFILSERLHQEIRDTQNESYRPFISSTKKGLS